MKLDREQFRAWLEAIEANSFGPSWSQCDCPLAQFISADPTVVFVEPSESLDSQGYYEENAYYELEGSCYELPTWANEFANRVDFQNGEGITTAECLAILDEVSS